MHQLEKIQAVIEYIEEHLTQKLDMNEIAGAVFIQDIIFSGSFRRRWE